ncbi:hypothetical protein C883_3342 [Bacillus stratosphericus LAMA 585]|nr:hypothetical protein C883_3342 [Bacillus stratosphericus LAMA 585]
MVFTSLMRSRPFWPMSSKRPRNGETYVAPALAARSAWFALKINVTFVLIPRSVNALTALRPSVVIGILTVIFGAIAASSFPSSIISSALREMTSALTEPDTTSVISRRRSWNDTSFSFATKLGFVVTPAKMPSSCASLMSAIFAVSTKNNITVPLSYQ